MEAKEEKSSADVSSHESGGLTLDGEVWKRKDGTTYTSVLDLYGAQKLFSQETTERYSDRKQEERELQEELREYLCSGMQQEENNDGELIEYIFSDEVTLSKIKNHADRETDYTLCVVLAAVFVALAFGSAMCWYSEKRRKRRENFAAEINMESTRTK